MASSSSSTRDVKICSACGKRQHQNHHSKNDPKNIHQNSDDIINNTSCLSQKDVSNPISTSTKMLRCSRCKSVWYCYVKCQRKHYRHHKPYCYPTGGAINSTTSSKGNDNNTSNIIIENKKKVSTTGTIIRKQRQNPSPHDQSQPPIYQCQNIQESGRGMISTQSIPSGTPLPLYYDATTTNLMAHRNQYSTCPYSAQPIVPPVLLQSLSSSPSSLSYHNHEMRCSFCFQTIKDTPITSHQSYMPTNAKSFRHYYCSQDCYRCANNKKYGAGYNVGHAWDFNEEEELISCFQSTVLMNASTSFRAVGSNNTMDSTNGTLTNEDSQVLLSPVCLLVLRIILQIQYEESLSTRTEEILADRLSDASLMTSNNDSVGGGFDSSASTTKQVMSQLCKAQTDLLSPLEKKYYEHVANVIIQALTLLDYIKSNRSSNKQRTQIQEADSNDDDINSNVRISCISEEKFGSKEEIITICNQIMHNSFSITNGENISMGIGIFPLHPASMVNHSCDPNLVQTFTYGVPSKLPGLVYTSCRQISPEEELKIAYTNPMALVQDRQEELQRGYKFTCKCNRCCKSHAEGEFYNGVNDSTNIDYDHSCQAIRCPVPGCKGYGYPSPTVQSSKQINGDSTEDIAIVYTCTKCNYQSGQSSGTSHTFDALIKKRDKAFAIVKECQLATTNDKYSIQSRSDAIRFLTLPPSSSNNNRIQLTKRKHPLNTNRKKILEILEASYEKLKQYTHMESWYVQESGDELVQCLLHQQERSQQNQDEHFHRAWVVLKELNTATSSKQYNPLRYLLNQFKEAKLELYLNPNPTDAIHRLQTIRDKLLIYYHPKSHEIIQEIDSSLQNAFF